MSLGEDYFAQSIIVRGDVDVDIAGSLTVVESFIVEPAADLNITLSQLTVNGDMTLEKDDTPSGYMIAGNGRVLLRQRNFYLQCVSPGGACKSENGIQ